MLANDIAKLMAMIPLQDVNNRKMNNGESEPQNVIKGMLLIYLFIKPFLYENTYF